MDNTYSVKQIADMLNTNPETVRRWIRDDKLKAVQVSRKSGNIITDSELKRFIKATPKYMPKLPSGLEKMNQPTSAAALTASLITGAILGYMREKEDVDVRVSSNDFKAYIKDNLDNMENAIQQKQHEIVELQIKIEQYNYLLENEDVLKNAFEKETQKEKEQED